MRKLFVLFFCAFFILSGSSQGQSFFYSDPEKFSFQNGDFRVVGWCGDRMYTYRSSKEGYFLNAYDDSMRLLAKISLDFFPQKIYDVRFINYPGKILVFFQAIQSNEVVQYAAHLDERGLLQGRPVSLASAKTGWFSGNKEYFTYAVSEDKQRIMILGWGNKNSAFSTILLDNHLNILARSNKRLQDEGSLAFHQAILNNEGELFLTTFAEKGAKRYGDEMSVLLLSADGKSLKRTSLPLDGVYLSGLYSKLNVNDNNELYSAAFYSDKKNGNLEGVLYAVFDAKGGSFPIFKNIPFDGEIKNAVDLKNKKKAFNNFEIRQILLKNDGGFLLTAENAFVTTRSNYPGGYGFYSSYYYAPFGNSSVREFIFGDILTLNFDAEGRRLWYSFIRKEQYSQEDNGLFSSFAMMNSGADIAFLFNNFSARSSFLSLAILNPQGKAYINKLTAGNRNAGDWIPRFARQTDLKEWVVPILKGNSLSFVRLVF